jgi:hypothetical protein
VNVDLGLRAAVSGGQVVLTWRPSGGFYRVWRGPAAQGDGFTCPPAPGARRCVVGLPEAGVTQTPRFAERPPPGRWVYRVAVAANWLDDPHYGDIYFVTMPIEVPVR